MSLVTSCRRIPSSIQFQFNLLVFAHNGSLIDAFKAPATAILQHHQFHHFFINKKYELIESKKEQLTSVPFRFSSSMGSLVCMIYLMYL